MKSLEHERRDIVDAVWLIVAVLSGIIYMTITTSAALGGDDCVNIPYYYTLCKTDYSKLFEIYVNCIRDGITLKTGRFFPFCFPTILVQALFFKSVATYRMYIIIMTYVAIMLVGYLIYKVTRKRNLSCMFVALCPLIFCIWYQPANNGLYSYMALPQSTLIPMVIAALCTHRWWNTGRKTKNIWLPIFFSFYSCATYELGFVLGLAVLTILWYQVQSLKELIQISLPIGVGEFICLMINIVSRMNNRVGTYEGIIFGFNLTSFLRCFKYQIAAALPLNTMIASDIKFEKAHIIDYLISLSIACAVTYFINRNKEMEIKTVVYVALLGGMLWILPAFLLALSAKYQQESWVNSTQGYIPAVIESMGAGVLFAAIIWFAFYWISRLRKWVCVLSCALLIVLLTFLGTYQRSATRNSWFAGRAVYDCICASLNEGLLDGVQEEDLVIGYFPVWGDSDDAHATLIKRYTQKNLNTLYWGHMDSQKALDYERQYAYGVGYNDEMQLAYSWKGQLTEILDDNSVVVDDLIVYLPEEEQEGLQLAYHTLENGEVVKHLRYIKQMKSAETEHGKIIHVEEKQVLMNNLSMANSQKAVQDWLKKLCKEMKHHKNMKWIKEHANGIVHGKEQTREMLYDVFFADVDVTDEDYVKLMYTKILGREPTKEETEMWIQDMESGLSKNEMMDIFLTSEEFCSKMGI